MNKSLYFPHSSTWIIAEICLNVLCQQERVVVDLVVDLVVDMVDHLTRPRF